MRKSFRRLGLYLLAPVAALGLAMLVPHTGGVRADDGEAADFSWKETGEELFGKNCAACHQSDGEGIEGFYPALKGNPFVLIDDPGVLIEVPLNGRGGMPSFDNLSDEELAAILSYVRNSWGNEADPVTPEMVAEVRGED